jgi:hypothetical protein
MKMKSEVTLIGAKKCECLRVCVRERESVRVCLSVCSCVCVYI